RRHLGPRAVPAQRHRPQPRIRDATSIVEWRPAFLSTERRTRVLRSAPAFGKGSRRPEFMGKTKPYHRHGDSDSDPVGFHRPYWKHAHHDWRLWIAVRVDD